MCQICYSWIARNPQVSTGQASNRPQIALALQAKSKQKLNEMSEKDRIFRDRHGIKGVCWTSQQLL